LAWLARPICRRWRMPFASTWAWPSLREGLQNPVIARSEATWRSISL
jgi:hypothetical protein